MVLSLNSKVNNGRFTYIHMCNGMFRRACHPIGTGLESEFELTGSNIYISCYVNLVFCVFHKGSSILCTLNDYVFGVCHILRF